MADKSSALEQLRVLSADELTALGTQLQGQTPLADVLEQNAATAERNTVKDTAVGIYDTLQTISTAALSPLPGVELADVGRISRELDQFRSPAYLAERASDAQRVANVSQTEGELAGFKESFLNTFEGGNLTADALSQLPFLAIGPAARAMGSVAAASVPGVLGKVTAAVGGTGEGAIINRIALLSGVLEGTGGYTQTYQRAIEQGLSPEEAHTQAQKAALAAGVAGTVLGRLTPGFELDPLGIKRGGAPAKFLGDVLAPSVSNVAGEVVEEGGIALTNQVADNILAGRKPMEGVGGQIGQAVAISSAFSGGIQSPGLVRDTSRAIGQGVTQALGDLASNIIDHAVTPEGAAVAAAGAKTAPVVSPLTSEEVIQSTGSSSEPAAVTPATATTQLTEDTSTQPNSTPEKPTVQEQYTLPLGEPQVRVKSVNSDVETILQQSALDTKAEISQEDGIISEEQAAAIESAASLYEAGQVAKAETAIEQTSDAEVASIVKAANQGDEQAQLVVQAIAATDMTRLPLEVIPETARPAVAALKAIPDSVARPGRADDVSDQILNRGWEQGGKAQKRKRGMKQYVNAVLSTMINYGRPDTTAKIDVAINAAKFMKHLDSRAAKFIAARELLNTIKKPENHKNPLYKPYRDTGYIEVEGTGTLDAEGKKTSDNFKIHIGNKNSEAMIDVILEDVAEARRQYDTLKLSHPKLMTASEQRADAEIAQLEQILAARQQTEDNAPVAEASAAATPTPRSAPVATEAVREARAERQAIQATERQEEQRIAKEKAEADAEAKAEREAIQAEAKAADEAIARTAAEVKSVETQKVEERPIQSADGEESPGVSDSGIDSGVVQKPVEQVVQNPLLKVTNWVRKTGRTFAEMFNVDPENSVDKWLNALNPDDRKLFEYEAKNLKRLLQGYKTKDGEDVLGILQEGILPILSREKPLDANGKPINDWEDKPYGISSALWIEQPTESGLTEVTVPEEVVRAFAMAGSIVVLKNAGRYDTPLDEDGNARREAIPAAWGAEVARVAMLLLGAKIKRNESVTISQGLPLAYGLSTVEALIQSGNFADLNGNEIKATKDLPKMVFQREGTEGEVYPSNVLIPTESAHKAATTDAVLNAVDRLERLIGGDPVWEAESEPITSVDNTIQYSNVPLTDAAKIALEHRQKVEHHQNGQLFELFTLVTDNGLKQLFTAFYVNSLPNKDDGSLPSNVREYIKSVWAGLELEFSAARKYDETTEKGTKPLFYKYHVGLNNRVKTVMGPQNYKFIRDLYSSAKETLNLDDGNHAMFMNMTLAQAFGVKTDINGPTEVLEKWAQIRPEWEAKARALQTALDNKNPAEVMSVLKQDKPWTARQLNALLTFGRMLKQDEKGEFENFLPFEIDGKTNGAFNTELFFGLGVHNGANLEQGGLFLNKEGTTWQAERARVESEYDGKDFYERINRGGLVEYVQTVATDIKGKGAWIVDSIKMELALLEAADMIEISRNEKGQPVGQLSVETVNANGETVITTIPQLPQISFKRDAGKISAIPVQYGGSAKGVKSQMWGMVAGNLNRKYIATTNELARTKDPVEQKKLRNQVAQLLALMDGMNTFGLSRNKLTDKTNPVSRGTKAWHFGLERFSKALHKAYRAEKSTVADMTDTLVQFTSLAFSIKKTQWDAGLTVLQDADAVNKALVEKYGTTGKYVPSREAYDKLASSTLDISFPTLNGHVSLNDTEFDRDTVKADGLGTTLTGNLNIPTPRKVGVRVLAMLTIGGGDAAMGADFFQGDWKATDVFDGIELMVSQFFTAGKALNDSVWNTAKFDLLNEFYRLQEDMVQYLANATPQEIGTVIHNWNASVPERLKVESTQEFQKLFNDSFDNFDTLYKEHRTGWKQLESVSHTLVQMGGGDTTTTEAKPITNELASLDDLQLELEDSAPRITVADLSQTGTREEGLYPNQYKDPRATRIEDEEGLIDVIMDGVRWVGKNTWNSAKAQKVNNVSAGMRRLMKVLALAVNAGATYDSDKSVHPSALRMYLKGKDLGQITWESRFTRAEIEEAIANNTILRTDNSSSQNGEPVFSNVRLLGRASASAVRVDSNLQTSFQVNDNNLDKAGVIAALDQLAWKNSIQRAVWKRIRNLLPADLMVTLAQTEAEWVAWKDAHPHGRTFGTVKGLAVGSQVALLQASPETMLHELIHTVFSNYLSAYVDNINSVPVELRGPINDLIQLMGRFKALEPTGRIGFVQKIMKQLAVQGDLSGELNEMLAYVLSEERLIEQASPGFITRVITRVKQILGRFIKLNIPSAFYDEVMDVFRALSDNIPADSVMTDSPQKSFNSVVEDYLGSLDQLTEDAYVDLFQRMAQGQKITLDGVQSENLAAQRMAEQAYNLSVGQQQLFTRVYTLLRVGQRSPALEQFVNSTFPSHPQKALFNKSKDQVAAVMALAAVEPTFAAQLNNLWAGVQEEQGKVESLIDLALNNAKATTSKDMLNESLSAMLVDREYNQSFLGTAAARLDRFGSEMLGKLGNLAFEKAQEAPAVVDNLLLGVSALTSERGASAFGATLLKAVNEHTDQRWLQDLVAALIGTQGDGKLFYRAHNAMMSAISQTRSMFDNTLPRALKELFPADFNGWNTLFESFGRLDVSVLGSDAREMYLNDVERQRMITVLESKVDNYIDAQNLAYYLVHRKPNPQISQELLRNARAIADNVNGRRITASDSLVADADQLVTLYAISYLTASERAKVGQFYRDHAESMDKLVGMLKHVKEAEAKDQKSLYKYVYWKDSLPLSTDPRSSVVLADSIKGASYEQLGYIKGPRFERTAGDPLSDLHYYTRKYSPPPVFSQGIIATVQQTAMGINYTTAATISPTVGTMITDKRVIERIKATKGRNSNLIAIYDVNGNIIGYERMLNPAIVRKELKGDNTLLHISIGKKLGRITEEAIARRMNEAAINLMVDQWKEGEARGQQGQYEQVNSTTDKQVARTWETIPADMKQKLEAAFPGGRVMVRKDLLANTVGYHNAGALELFTGDASIDPQTRKIVLGLVQTVFMGPKGTQIFLAAEQALKETVATARDLIIVRSLTVAYQNALASVHLVLANGVPPAKIFKWYQQGMKEVRAYNKLQREVIQLTVQISGTTDPAEKTRLRTIQTAKRRTIERLSIYPLVEAGDLSDLPEGLEDQISHSYLGDLAGWMNNHLREKVHPKAPTIVANVLFAKDSVLHDGLSKAIQAGDFLARYAIYQHMIASGKSEEEARDRVRDELVSYQTNPGRMRAALETYGMIWWSQFTLRAQNVLLRRFRQNPFSFFVSQGLGNLVGTPGPLDGAIWNRGLDNSIGIDQVLNADSAYIYSKLY